ncbi:hypothetical protein N5853_05780 [Bartonella sp. HY329]|uniref:hypothetical protein n=1 Tax=unclassified Bartonella TaxID=2645622 RepID=UPI0021C686C6|nr:MULTISPECIES: hypothetical protein [unclassified Bartonella]UXM96124.1 hypothetical protein N5853_05780 [Bartonella sp. HY329]UXN10448.1 hypothetical protein N5852_05785 [Bartonella sp. HY328]
MSDLIETVYLKSAKRGDDEGIINASMNWPLEAFAYKLFTTSGQRILRSRLKQTYITPIKKYSIISTQLPTLNDVK